MSYFPLLIREFLPPVHRWFSMRSRLNPFWSRPMAVQVGVWWNHVDAYRHSMWVFSHQFQQHLSCVGYTITWTTDHLMMLQQEWRSSFLFLFCFVYFNTKNTVDIPLFRSTRNRVWNVVFLKNDSWVVGYVYVKKNFFYIVPWNLRCLSYN